MISRQLKALYYFLFSYLMLLNSKFYKIFRSPKSGMVKVHLGPGKKNYLNGWINVDANIITAKIDVWADIKHPLPFQNDVVDVFYSHHVIEHLPNIQKNFHEMYRCLKKNSFIRIGGPHGDNAIKKFTENDLKWFGDFPEKRQSIGGKLDNYLLCKNEHLAILTKSYLIELASNAGFKNMKFCIPTKQTFHPELIDQQIFEKEWESDLENPHTIIMEAEKI